MQVYEFNVQLDFSYMVEGIFVGIIGIDYEYISELVGGILFSDVF